MEFIMIAVLVVLLLILIICNIVIVQQSRAYVVERLIGNSVSRAAVEKNAHALLPVKKSYVCKTVTGEKHICLVGVFFVRVQALKKHLKRQIICI